MAIHQQRRGQGIIMTRPSRSPSPKISSAVSDVDGKLVTDQKLLTERTKAAVAALHSMGHRSGNDGQSRIFRADLFARSVTENPRSASAVRVEGA